MAVAALRSLWPVLLLGCLALLEPLSAIFGGAITQIAAWSWVVMAAVSLTVSWKVIVGRLWAAGRARHGMLLLVFLVGGLLTFGRIGSHTSLPINREATQQVAAGLEAWQKPNLGYHESAFLSGSYPTRQYLLVSVPSLVMGRDLVPLRLGFAFLFFTGWALFLVTLGRRWSQQSQPDERQASPLPVIAALSVFTFPLVSHWLFNYEQTIIPLSLTLLTVAWAIEVSASGRTSHFLPLGWSAGMLGTCYSTGLTVWLLCIALGFAAVLFWRHLPLVQKKTERWAWLGAAAYVTSMGASTVWTMRLILPGKFTTRTIITEAPMSAETFWTRIQEGFQALLVHPFFPFFHPLVALAFALPLIALLARRPSRETLLPTALWIWMIGTIIASVTLRGYCHRPPPFDLHRAMVIVPILLLLTGDFWRNLLGVRLERWTPTLRLFVVAVGAAAAGQASVVRDPVSYARYEADSETAFLMRINQFWHDLPRKEMTPSIWVDPALPTGGGLHDCIGYFFPGVQYRRERPNLVELEKEGQPFAVLLHDSEVEHAAILEARVSAEVLPGRPRLHHLPKQYLTVIQRGNTGHAQ